MVTQEDIITASAINPFDRSYNELQRKFDSTVLNLLSDLCNFTVRITETPLITDLNTYEIHPNVWIFEQLVNGTCDISSTTMVLSPETAYPVSYSLSTGYFRPQLFYKARSVREEYNIYYIPFSPDVWVSLFGLLLVITMALTFILGRETKLPHDTPYDIIARIADEHHDEGKKWNENTSKETLLERERWEIGEILLIAIGALGQQGSARDPSTSAARTLLLVMFLLAILAYTAYSASVISFVSLIPDTEKEESSVTKSVPLEKAVALQDTNFFKHSFNSFFTEITYVDIHKGLDDAISGRTLFVGDRDICLTHIHRKGYGKEQRCSLARLFLGIQHQRVFAIRNGLEFKEAINIKIVRFTLRGFCCHDKWSKILFEEDNIKMSHNIFFIKYVTETNIMRETADQISSFTRRFLARLQEFGLLSRERRRFFDIRYPCTFKERSSISGFVSFDIQDIKPALWLFGSGLCFSLLLLLMELFTFSSSKVIKKFCYSRWTANDERVNDLISKFITRKTISDELEKSKGEERYFSLQHETLDIQPLPFLN